MRLTLATLLAYLDNVLEPADAQVLHEKIEKSDFASGLVMRIRSISRKLRMGAPKVEGKGLGRDANSVAEYLDGSLAPERLGEFERLCLESDVQLAEVASCHQVLAMVLNKPAEVPAAIREKIYALASAAEAARLAAPNRIDGAHASNGTDVLATTAGTGAPPLPPKPSTASTSASMLAVPSDNGKAAAPEPVAPPMPKELEVPDYLRASRGSSTWIRWAAIAAIFLLAIAVLRAMGPFDKTHPIAKMMGMGPEVAVAPVNPTPVPNPNPNPNPVVPATIPGPPKPVPMPNPMDVRPVPGETLTPGLPPVPPVTPMPPELPSNPIPPEPMPRPEVPPLPVPVPGSIPGDDPVALKPVDPVKPTDKPPLPVPPPPVIPANPSEMVDVGRFTSDEQVLARLAVDPKNNMTLWYRLAPRSLLNAGERLVVLPTYRPQLTLASGVQATFAGESAFRVEKPAKAGNARMTVEYGRFVLTSVGAMGGHVELDLNGITGVVSLADADAAIAVEVRRFLPPGVAAEKPDAPLIRVVDLFATGGRVMWKPSEGPAIEIPAMHVTTYIAEEFPRNAGPFEPPAWTDAKSMSDIERRASLSMEADLRLDSPLDISLNEQAAGRLVEVRSLAARSLAALDEYAAILAELNDTRQYSYWAGDIDSLRQAISRSPASAGKVLATLQNQRPQNARLIYDMLLGASDEQLVGGVASIMVKSLESNEVDVRVVALDTLRRTTGLMLMYRPEKPLASNTTSIQKWKEKLKDNLIINRVAPTPQNEFKASPK
ncbi:hypothetical protein [Anatilimnocola floriformis]|uniref:hypothetical protein n=1 Tax=Anatilimnocola floriformis TaxID=2948575 RepID=UPI0020C51FCD|nr:hypothetical protein [Anatilimnocola floriformis]